MRRPSESQQSFAASISSRQNGITAGRTFLALIVVVSHSFSIIGMPEPLVAETGQVSLGLIAVYGFFGLSGYLLTRSRVVTPALPFLWNRALRILPGYWAALAFGAIAAAIGAGMIGLRLQPADMNAYVASNVVFVPGMTTVEPAFGGTPVNGSLWTLGIEVLCYLGLALTPRRWTKPVAIGLVPALLALWTSWSGVELQLGLAFLTGSCAYLLRIPITTSNCVLAMLLATICYATHLTPLASMAVAFAAIGFARMPIRLDRDVSYGIYVFAYPLGQVLAVAGLASWGVGGLIAGTVGLVIPIAWLSWTLIESRAMRLRRLAAISGPRSSPAGLGLGSRLPFGRPPSIGMAASSGSGLDRVRTRLSAHVRLSSLQIR